jgi:hypothetical protein
VRRKGDEGKRKRKEEELMLPSRNIGGDEDEDDHDDHDNAGRSIAVAGAAASAWFCLIFVVRVSFFSSFSPMGFLIKLVSSGKAFGGMYMYDRIIE